MCESFLQSRRLRLVAIILLVAHVGCSGASAQNRTGSRRSPKNETLSAAEAKDIGQDWVRIKYDAGDDPIAMQTAIVRYTPAKSSGIAESRRIAVDLIGAVHIADV